MFLCFSPRTSEFITQQMQIITAMQAEQEQRIKEADERKSKRQQQYAVPPLPKP